MQHMDVQLTQQLAMHASEQCIVPKYSNASEQALCPDTAG